MNATVLCALRNFPLVARLLDGYNGHAVCGLRQTNLFEACWQLLAHDVRRGAVLVVDAEQALLVIAEIPHAVVANTDALLLLFGGETGVFE